ncbi:MAG TPA: hypothetical protein VE998_08335 [Terriglobales bacterium]|nr:hypothetical protein [Terriglobales bacterium]
MPKQFDRRAAGGNPRLIKSTCNSCQHPVATSHDQAALKIAEEAHLKNNESCGQPAVEPKPYPPESAVPHSVPGRRVSSR